ncbi:maltose phosphorylase [Halolactibacillus alkaliphilus]|uniref:Maltose phosphorylase n=1 Tax=Halolactibacillus alkaliphilus TaxID=442899 RepID=A0A511WZI0_9BACI|nr:glycoside hydrolase family 65 protein [Halolactibacillus alkaliphilus]GEN56088.1 maltose phosphorylase [Halolactibacillus alkaliphilus]GGN67261.1 maltose phosphorylase [Halolactibacillus alkaliphilus]SFO71240.1 maltose phosphorylase [Halolactibacillus alkaliphilus]
MKPYLKEHPWSIIEEGFDKDKHEISESIFSIGNGHMGQRANFEETYTGKSLQGSYMAGVYYPDKTRVGWWKNGYPEYFAKVLNATNWIGLKIVIDGVELDLNTADVTAFRRELNMKEGYLSRTFSAKLHNGHIIDVEATRFVSITSKEIGAIEYKLTPVNFDGEIEITSYLDGDIINSDANYDEKFWASVNEEAFGNEAVVTVKTKKLDFYYTSKKATYVYTDGDAIKPDAASTREKYAEVVFHTTLKKGKTTVIYKYAANVTNRDYQDDTLEQIATKKLHDAVETGFETLMTDQKEAWAKKWQDSDIVIEGDVSAQQGIRFNIFHMNQTYTGEDARLNIGPKGFTGEKYGGSTYWDTEAYCLPFYLATADQRIARNLLVYRHNHLEKAKENAKKLGFSKGALYPMVTMNGEECHNEWEITFEEIHRNGAIAYAIYDYVNYTGDKAYIGELGIEVLVEISRFWEERVHYVPRKDVYMMHGVTGPNEYDNNVNNNWYTNRIASWTLEYTLECLEELKMTNPATFDTWIEQLQLSEVETTKWQEIIDKMYYPVDEDLDVFLQADNFLDKEIMKVEELDAKHLPLNQNWSWDRILRSCFIKQADVLQGLHFLNHTYDLETIKRNFDFYEPMTVHESSLSPCVHSILACQLGYQDKAYDMYLRTARLDLDNYNNDTEDGCHITSMAGTWMSVVQGFGGMKVIDQQLHLRPFIPGKWDAFSFKIVFRGARLNIRVTQAQIDITNESHNDIDVIIFDESIHIKGNETMSVATN